jgi:hypothetical protein
MRAQKRPVDTKKPQKENLTLELENACRCNYRRYLASRLIRGPWLFKCL